MTEVNAFNFENFIDDETQERWEDNDNYQNILEIMRSWYKWVSHSAINLDEESEDWPNLNSIGETTMNYIDMILLQSKENWGSFFLVKDFIEMVQEGTINDYDGEGYFVDKFGNEQKENPGYIKCDIDWLINNSHDFPFVKWFNK